MYYGYKIETTEYGWVPAYTDEFNVPADAWPLSMLTVHDVTQHTSEVGCAIVAKPIVNQVGMVTGPVGDVSMDSLPQIGTVLPGGIQLGEAITQVPQNAVVAEVQIGVVHIYVVIIVVALCIAWASTMFLIFSDVVTDFYAEREWYKTEQHYYDLVAQFQKVTNEEYLDCNGDGVNDVVTRTWGNGSVVQFALNAEGVECMGGVTYKVIQEGAELPEPPEEYSEPIDWGFILIVGFVGIGAVILLPKIANYVFPRRDERPRRRYYD